MNPTKSGDELRCSGWYAFPVPVVAPETDNKS